jgi:hypothetical protein
VTALISLLVILALSLVVVRVASEALTLTGLSRETARFQARSAWTGTGFTTSESEQVMNHPVRRRIISGLILMRNAGLVTMASTLVLSFMNVEDRSSGLLRLGLLVGGLLVLWLIAGSRWIEHRLSRLIAWALKRFTNLDTRDYAGLLHLAGEYAIMEMEVRSKGWMDKRTLDGLELSKEGILILGIIRPGGHYVGAPSGLSVVGAGDRLVLYGRSPVLDQLSKRPADPHGDREHQLATQEQERAENREDGPEQRRRH